MSTRHKQAYVKTCRRTVTTAGTPEPFRTGVGAGGDPYFIVKSLTIRAYTTNTGNVYVGDSNRVSSTDYSYILAPGETVSLDATDVGPQHYIFLTQIWLDVDTDGEGLCWIAISDVEPW